MTKTEKLIKDGVAVYNYVGFPVPSNFGAEVIAYDNAHKTLYSKESYERALANYNKEQEERQARKKAWRDKRNAFNAIRIQKAELYKRLPEPAENALILSLDEAERVQKQLKQGKRRVKFVAYPKQLTTLSYSKAVRYCEDCRGALATLTMRYSPRVPLFDVEIKSCEIKSTHNKYTKRHLRYITKTRKGLRKYILENWHIPPVEVCETHYLYADELEFTAIVRKKHFRGDFDPRKCRITAWRAPRLLKDQNIHRKVKQ